MKKRILSFIMALALVIAGVVVPEPERAYAASNKISSAEDLLAMEENPSGDYVLTKDITVPKNTSLFVETPFIGTLNGNGHKLKGYKSTASTAIFANARYAQFKNLSVTGVDIRVDGSVAALVGNSDNCEFYNISVSGKIVSGGDGGSVGAIAASGSGSMEKCKSSAKITAKTEKAGKSVGGLAGDFQASILKNCSNSGAVTLTTGTDTYVFDPFASGGGDDSVEFSVAGLVAGEPDRVSSCKNSGSVTANMKFKVDDSKYPHVGASVYAGGICKNVKGPISSSGNTGKITVSSAKSAEYLLVCVGGVAARAGYGTLWNDKTDMTKCYNTGAVSFSGISDAKVGIDMDASFWVGGLFGTSRTISQCYNTGKVSASFLTGSKGVSATGGIAGEVTGSINHCYNTGSVTVTNKGKKSDTMVQAGGLAGYANVLTSYGSKQGNASCNYATGKVSGPKNSSGYTGGLIGRWAGPFMAHKSLIYNNYCTGSGSAYGGGDTTWKAYQPTAKKVSSITSGSCPRLSSKYWTYSSKHRRLILKNNKEK